MSSCFINNPLTIIMFHCDSMMRYYCYIILMDLKKSKLENVNYKQYFENRLLEVKSSFFERISELDFVDINVEDKYEWINITGTFKVLNKQWTTMVRISYGDINEKEI